jgi:hypothetical protein
MKLASGPRKSGQFRKTISHQDRDIKGHEPATLIRVRRTNIRRFRTPGLLAPSIPVHDASMTRRLGFVGYDNVTALDLVVPLEACAISPLASRLRTFWSSALRKPAASLRSERVCLPWPIQG